VVCVNVSDTHIMPLTETKCRNAKPTGRPYRLPEGKGLYLEVRPAGTKLWHYRYRIAGKQNLYALGEYPVTSLEAARTQQSRALELVKLGIHPSPARRAEKSEGTGANSNTFEAVAREWLAIKGFSGRQAAQDRSSPFLLGMYSRTSAACLSAVTAQQMLAIVNRIVKRGTPAAAPIAWSTSRHVFALAKKTERLKASPISDTHDVILSTIIATRAGVITQNGGGLASRILAQVPVLT
jgi:hypothetical protein